MAAGPSHPAASLVQNKTAASANLPSPIWLNPNASCTRIVSGRLMSSHDPKRRDDEDEAQLRLLTT